MTDLNALAEEFASLKDPFKKADFLIEIEKKGIATKNFAKVLGVNKSYLSHFKRLRKLPDLIIDGFYAGSITLSHLFVISRLSDRNQMIFLYEKVLRENLSVKDTENEVRRILYSIEDGNGKYFPDKKKKDIINLIKEKLEKELDVKIIQTRVKLKIIMEAKGNLRATNKFLEKFIKFLQFANKE